MSGKAILIKEVVENAVTELELMDTSDEEVDEVLDDAFDDLNLVLSCRYAFRGVVPKSRVWLTDILPRLDNNRFRQMIRVSRRQYRVILDEIQDHEVFHGQNSSLQLPVATQVCLFLFRFGICGSGASPTKISTFFGVGDGGSIDKITKRVMKAILSLDTKYITWPDKSERTSIVLSTSNEMPKCIGYVDGSEFALDESPTLDHVSYFSRKQRYSIKAQAVSDHRMKIRHLVIGFPGSVHDARIFANSELGKSPDKFFSDGQWLAGDSAYRLTEHVITPFRNTSTNGTQEERKKFNKYFSGFRVRIETCFGILKERFGSLKELRIRIKDEESHKFACDWIRCACILHNMLLPYLEDEDFEFEHCELGGDDDEVPTGLSDDACGETKRSALFSIILDKLNN